MKKKIILFIGFALSVFFCNAQNKIAVHHNGSSSFYNQLDTAITYAQNGDTIYLPGGSYSLSLNITKNLCIIGVGHNPDSTQATNYSLINGNVNLRQGASGGSLTGVYLVNGIYLFDTLSNYIVSRCNSSWISFQSIHPTNNFFGENVVRGTLAGFNSSNNYFSNNIIGSNSSSVISFNSGTRFSNNIFFGEIGFGGTIYQTTFENNIFRFGTLPSVGGLLNCVLNNNLYVPNLVGCGGGCVASGNLINQPIGSIFVNSTGSTFNYTENYNLQASCPGNNAGTDGTDMGIYGGAFPWKAGSVPFNPHIQFKNIANTTDANGNLNINIQVGAQDH